MAKDTRPISPYYPLMLAVALVAGLFIGHDMSTSTSGPINVFRMRTPGAADKIGQVLDLIDRQYVDTVEKNALVDEVLQDILQRLDPHSYYISAAELRAAQEPLEGSFDGIGVEFAIQRDTVMVVAAVEGGPSEALGIRAGDRLLKADGKTISGVGITNDGVMKTLRGKEGSEVTVSILRRSEPKPFDVIIKRGKIPIHSVAASILSSDGTGYIKLVRFAKNTHDEFLKAATELEKEGMERLVLDLRGNGGGYLNAAIDLADEFLPNGRVIVYTEGRNSPRRDVIATRRGQFESMPLAILIDEGSASASEIIAGAMQDNDRAVIVGRRSFGKGLVQEHVDLPDQSAVRLTTARYYTASGRSIQRPYGEGIDYAGDYTERFMHGELVTADSIHLDSSQIYTTLNGRTVYGGGGVMPDIFVSADTSEGSNYLSELFYTGALNQFALDVADRDRKQLLGFGSPRGFRDRYVISSALLNELGSFAQKQGIEPNPSDLDRSRQQIAIRLKAGIARNLWGNASFYEIMLDSDKVFEQAKEKLDTPGA